MHTRERLQKSIREELAKCSQQPFFSRLPGVNVVQTWH